MRVIAGKAKGTQLLTPDGILTRPTIDRVKEALFSILQFDLPGAKVLDLFGGTGQLGIEASVGSGQCGICGFQAGGLPTHPFQFKKDPFGAVRLRGPERLSGIPESVQGAV